MISYLHNLRGLAIFLVVLIHSMYMIPTSIRNDFPLIFAFHNATYLFVVIAGYFFSMLVDRYSYYSYLRSKFKNVFLPYVFVSIPAILIYVLGVKESHLWVDVQSVLSESYFNAVLFFYLTGAHLGPLWFIPMVCLFYLLFPLFRIVLMNGWGIYVLFIFSMISGYYLGRPELNNNTFLSFNYFLSAYVFGFILERTRVHERFSRYFGMVIFTSVLLFYEFGFSSGYSYRLDLLVRVFYCFSVFSLFFHYFNSKNKIFGFLGDKSFFIFFIHGYFVGFSRMIDIDLNIYAGSVLIFSIVIFLTMISYFLVKLVFRSKTKLLFGTD